MAGRRQWWVYAGLGVLVVASLAYALVPSAIEVDTRPPALDEYGASLRADAQGAKP